MNRFFTRLVVALFGLLLALPAVAATPPLGKDTLRQLVHLPIITFQPNWTYDPEQGFTLGSSDDDLTQQITTLHENLKNDNRDAEAHQQISDLYAAQHDLDNSRKAAARAVELFRQRLESQPDDPTLLIALGTALNSAGKMAEAESVLRKAVQLTPKNWHARLALARLLDAAARRDIYDRPPLDTDLPTSTEVVLAQHRLLEAGDDFDQAVAAAPTESEVYVRRAQHRCLRAVLLKQIRLAQGEPPDELALADNSFSPEALADLQHASRLSPRDYHLIGAAALFEIYTTSAHKGRVNWADFSWNSLPDASQNSLHDSLTRLENLGQDSDPQLAAGALEILGILQGPVFHETHRCVTTLRRALALDPTRQHAAEVLISTLAQSGRYDDLLTACEDLVKQKDTARNHLFLAKAYEKLKQWDDVEAEVLEALRQAPADFTANLDFAALLLRRSSDAETLNEANTWLSRAEGLVGQMSTLQHNQQVIIDLTLTRSIYFALNDEVDSARQWAQAVLKTDPTNKQAHEILSAMDY